MTPAGNPLRALRIGDQSLLTITSNAVSFTKALEAVIAKQVPFATALALNDTATDVHADLVKRMSEVFDRPTPFTMGAFMIYRATKAALVSSVETKPQLGSRHYLRVEETGGPRRQTGFERLMGDRVAYAGVLQTILPADGAKLDAYGNWSKGERNQVQSAINAQRDPYSNMTKASFKRHGKRSRYFVPRHGLTPGVYRRDRNGTLNIILAFSAVVPTYTPRLGFEENGHRVAATRFPRHFRKRLIEALASAR